jgi:hypothetical protein
MDFPLSTIEHISKYSFIEKFMKLPFQGMEEEDKAFLS